MLYQHHDRMNKDLCLTLSICLEIEELIHAGLCSSLFSAHTRANEWCSLAHSAEGANEWSLVIPELRLAADPFPLPPLQCMKLHGSGFSLSLSLGRKTVCRISCVAHLNVPARFSVKIFKFGFKVRTPSASLTSSPI